MIFRKKDTSKILEPSQADLYKEKLSTMDFLFNDVLEELDPEEKTSQEKIKVLNLICDLIRKEIIWSYNSDRFGKSRNNKTLIDIYDEKIIPSKKELLNLKDKAFIVDCWRPDKYLTNSIINYDLDFLTHTGYTYYYFKNLKIGYVGSGGNHRLLRQLIENKDNKAYVYIKDDTYILKNYHTDGEYLINDMDDTKAKLFDYRMAVLFTLTQRLSDMAREDPFL